MIKIRVLHTGSVCVSPALPFGGNEKNPLKISPVFTRKKDRLWLPVSSYLIEHPKGKVLFDCGIYLPEGHDNPSGDASVCFTVLKEYALPLFKSKYIVPVLLQHYHKILNEFDND